MIERPYWAFFLHQNLHNNKTTTTNARISLKTSADMIT